MCISAGPCSADYSPAASPSQASPGSPASPAYAPWSISMTMGEMATPRSPLQSDSEGSTSSLELGSGVAGLALHGTPPPTSAQEAVKCRWQHCGLWLGSLDALALHVTLAHAAAGRGGLFYCGWEGCSRGYRGFNARYKMLVHVRTHTNERPHRCGQCDKSFSRAENLKIHARSHTGERPYTCPVPGCSKAYSNSSDRFKHTRTHAVDKPYVCKVEGCPKRYTDPSSLRKHVKTYRHFPSGSGGSATPPSDHEGSSPQGSERDSHSPLLLSPSSDEEAAGAARGAAGSAFRPVGGGPAVSPSALERPPLPGECRGIPIKKAISARVRAHGSASTATAGPRNWAGGSVWVGAAPSAPAPAPAASAGTASPDALSLSLSPSSSPSPSPSSSSGSAVAPDWFGSPPGGAGAPAPLYASPLSSPSPPWAWGPMLSLWAFPPVPVPVAPMFRPPVLPAGPVPVVGFEEPAVEPAPLDLSVARH
ncbi:Zinc finger protein GLIS2-like protein [Frankliniella fusca]|uniref:Zinc finger protein GLIS2-like protein n=1 Tax=Frankliniella fusca TaxID=407009 RepID=A0AAE1HTH6_9NEOP|nr:Zinc finger protein GLIS2-like protein [Frankliniella fusca]